MEMSAVISPCEKYRYVLRRVWDSSKPLLTYVLLNPSTADHVEDDATMTRCIKRSKLLGYGGMVVLNVFAYRTKDPALMKAQADPIGPENDQYLVTELQKADCVILGWGGDGNHLGRGAKVIEMLRNAGVQIKCLALNGDGTPRHPLYIGYDVKPQLF